MCMVAGDEDCDGLPDCMDPDCNGMACGAGNGRMCSSGSCMCPGGSSEGACNDTMDNDCDTLVDCNDPDCSGDPCGAPGFVCVGTSCMCPGGATESNCGDFIDNDCDGDTDCFDGDCTLASCGPGQQCSNELCLCFDCTEPTCNFEVCRKSVSTFGTCEGGICQ